MLVGLVSKNGILIVEFANQRKLAGLSMREAIEDSAVSRLRPILMTSLSTVLAYSPDGDGHGCGFRESCCHLLDEELDDEEVTAWLKEKDHVELLEEIAAIRQRLTEGESQINDEDEYRRLEENIYDQKSRRMTLRWSLSGFYYIIDGTSWDIR